MYRSWKVRSIRTLIAVVLAVGSWMSAGGIAQAKSLPAGAVFALTNAVDNNAVAMYDRASDGTLRPVGWFFTGGSGTGSGLGSQGALALSDDRHWLFAVNAGS